MADRYGAVPISEEYPDGRRRYSAEEEAEANARDAQFIIDKPMEDWKLKMVRTDAGMPRYLEDHITDGHEGDAGNEFLQVKYDAKIKLREERP